MQKPVPMDNLRFGRLVVLHYVETRKKKRRYLCRCDCGKLPVVAGTDLRYGGTKSCGCMRVDNNRLPNEQRRKK